MDAIIETRPVKTLSYVEWTLQNSRIRAMEEEVPSTIYLDQEPVPQEKIDVETVINTIFECSWLSSYGNKLVGQLFKFIIGPAIEESWTIKQLIDTMEGAHMYPLAKLVLRESRIHLEENNGL